MKSESNRPITLEDLLRLKRAERPPAEFWSEFDRNLRAKQLAALVEKRPWWQNRPRLLPSFSRLRLPLGASAVLALTILSVRHYHSTPSLQVDEAAAVGVAQTTKSVGAPEGVTNENVADNVVANVSVAQAETFLETPATVAADVATTGEISRAVSLGGSSGRELEREGQSSAGRSIVADLAAVQAAEPVATRGLFGAANGFESRAMPARTPIEPLQQMSPPGETRRTRLFTAMVSPASFDYSPRATERAANRIAEDQLYDRVRRLDTRGNAINLKL